MTVVILGGTGFIGRHLAHYCQQLGESVIVTGRNDPGLEELQFEPVDVLDLESLSKLFQIHKPRYVYHLAGFSSSYQSRRQPSLCYRTNILGTQNVLSALAAKAPRARLLIVGSAAEYGAVTEADLPILESCVLRPISPYGVSRVAASLMGQQQRQQKAPIETVVVRLFNIFGPGQKPNLICSEFARHFAQAKKLGLQSLTLQTGDLSLRRDFSSVFQAVIGLHLAMQKAEAFEIYNLCSGQARELRSIVRSLEEISGLTAKLEQRSQKVRSGDPKCIVGSAEKLFQGTGFRVADDFMECLGQVFVQELENSFHSS